MDDYGIKTISASSSDIAAAKDFAVKLITLSKTSGADSVFRVAESNYVTANNVYSATSASSYNSRLISTYNIALVFRSKTMKMYGDNIFSILLNSSWSSKDVGGNIGIFAGYPIKKEHYRFDEARKAYDTYKENTGKLLRDKSVFDYDDFKSSARSIAIGVLKIALDNIISNNYMFQDLASQVQFAEAKIPTLAVPGNNIGNKIVILYNPIFILQKCFDHAYEFKINNVEELVKKVEWLILHECMHVFIGHTFAKEQVNNNLLKNIRPSVINKIGDSFINSYLNKEYGFNVIGAITTQTELSFNVSKDKVRKHIVSIFEKSDTIQKYRLSKHSSGIDRPDTIKEIFSDFYTNWVMVINSGSFKSSNMAMLEGTRISSDLGGGELKVKEKKKKSNEKTLDVPCPDCGKIKKVNIKY